MNDIKFAKEHMGEYFQFREVTVRVIGYDVTGTDQSVIVDHPEGWEVETACPQDAIYKDLCETGRCYYVNWEDLK